ncbi:hypothetical protein JYT91_01520 [archaeon AH-315-M20]|nr:hypothetical protein [archaeon AH-315-M20]
MSENNMPSQNSFINNIGTLVRNHRGKIAAGLAIALPTAIGIGDDYLSGSAIEIFDITSSSGTGVWFSGWTYLAITFSRGVQASSSAYESHKAQQRREQEIYLRQLIRQEIRDYTS